MQYNSRDASGAKRWLDAGVAAHNRGDIAQAMEAYRQVLAQAPGHADALNLLGTALMQLGDPAAALPLLQQAALKQKANAGLLANLGQAYLGVQQPAQAAEAFRKAVRIAPGEFAFQLGLGAALATQGKLAEAEPLLRRLTTRFPDAAPAWYNLGNVLRDRKAVDEAVCAYKRTLEIEPAWPDAINNLGSAYQSTLRFGEAEAHYRRCLEIDPDHLLARFNLASVVMDLGRFAEAEAICRDLVARAPNAATAHTILGAAIGHQGRLIETRECHARAARLAPDDPNVVENLAAVLMETGRATAGLRGFSHALALRPEVAAPRQLLGVNLLAHAMLQDGWNEYAWRPAALRFREKYPQLSLARNLPDDLHGKHVCLLREQGLGDEIFFLRYAPVLAARGARITYRASNKLASMLARVPCLHAIVEEMAPLPEGDANILLGDLPHALGALASTPLPLSSGADAHVALPECEQHVQLYWPFVPRSIRLAPLPDRLAASGVRLAALGPPPYIGVTWRAGTLPEEQKSVTWLLYKTIDLHALANALRGARGTLLALQRNPAPGEIETLAAATGRAVYDFTALNEDLEGMLALLALLDDYVAVSNTNVHLREAVGRTSRVLVPTPAEWRWRQSGHASPWFPGTAVYRQSLQGDWSDALESLRRDLTLNSGAGARSNSA